MIRLADYLFRWTGDASYADYIERNLYNGILAQQHPKTGMIAYFLPLEAGARKIWGHPTYDFWCCHGTLVQAHTLYPELIYYSNNQGITISQYIPSELHADFDGTAIVISQNFDAQNQGVAADNSSAAGSRHRPKNWVINLSINCDKPTEFILTLRIPWWINGAAIISINDIPQKIESKPGSFISLNRKWGKDTLRIEFSKSISVHRIPDEPNTIAFLDGPVVMAGLCDREQTLVGDKNHPESILVPDNEREWGNWLPYYRTSGQTRNLRLMPLYEIIDQPYTLYFPIQEKS
jgi:DUF1680 family protein